jgi:SAM-dependent methyltransferase
LKRLYSFYKYHRIPREKKILPAQWNLDVNFYPYAQDNAYEYFDSYSIFYTWVWKELSSLPKKEVLSIGGKKLGDALLGEKHRVVSIVLKDPHDPISSVEYRIHDLSDPLPFKENSFHFAISPSTLHLIGMGRYGDKINPSALFTALPEIYRVLKPGGSLYFSTLSGKDALMFNHGYIFQYTTWKTLLEKYGFSVESAFLDLGENQEGKERIVPAKDLPLPLGEYRYIFIKATKALP